MLNGSAVMGLPFGYDGLMMARGIGPKAHSAGRNGCPWVYLVPPSSKFCAKKTSLVRLVPLFRGRTSSLTLKSRTSRLGHCSFAKCWQAVLHFEISALNLVAQLLNSSSSVFPSNRGSSKAIASEQFLTSSSICSSTPSGSSS